ncbi:MAG: transposase [Candidatus Kariarchaeaceae archaeon]|jgi:transposase
MKKQPANTIFKTIPEKLSDQIQDFATKSGWDQPLKGRRHYKASTLMFAILLFYIKQMSSLDALVCHLEYNPIAFKSCGFEEGEGVPSRSTFSRFLRQIGPDPFEDLFYQLVGHLQAEGNVRGRHIAIDSTHVSAWSDRKSKNKKHPDFKIAKNCNFARLGLTPKGFDVCYRVQTATVTKDEIPIAVEVIPGNVNDKKAFESIFEKSLQIIPNPLAVSADRGYSSGKNRKLIQEATASCVIRPSKTDLARKTIQDFLPTDMSEYSYWRVYWRRNAVERTFAFAKGYCGLDSPRVVNENPVKQHVFISFCILLLIKIACKEMGLEKTKYSIFI